MGVGGPGTARGAPWTLAADEEHDLRDFLEALGDTPAGGPVGWALGRFEMGCERPHEAEALSDYLLGLRALLDATSEAGEASLGLRVAALCAEEGQRRAVQRRIEAALSLERFLMGGRGSLQERIGSESPRDLVREMETHLRALLRDVLCGYLEPDLKSVADDILLETAPEPFALDEERDSEVRVEARDLRRPEPEPEPDPQPELDLDPEVETTEFEAIAEAEPVAVAPAPPRRSHGIRRLGLGRPRRTTRRPSRTPAGSPAAPLAAEQVVVHSRQAVEVVHVVVEPGHLDQRRSVEPLAQPSSAARSRAASARSSSQVRTTLRASGAPSSSSTSRAHVRAMGRHRHAHAVGDHAGERQLGLAQPLVEEGRLVERVLPR